MISPPGLKKSRPARPIAGRVSADSAVDCGYPLCPKKVGGPGLSTGYLMFTADSVGVVVANL